MKEQPIMVSKKYLQDILDVLKQSLDCLAEYAGNDSETLDHLIGKYEQWEKILKPYTATNN
jgi:hypothetical protein